VTSRQLPRALAAVLALTATRLTVEYVRQAGVRSCARTEVACQGGDDSHEVLRSCLTARHSPLVCLRDARTYYSVDLVDERGR
jgi:hypothetical protein